MTEEGFVAEIAARLESAGVPFMLTGSHGSSYYGQPRATNDADFVIDPTQEQLDRLIDLLGAEFYVSRDAAHDALRHRSMFNVILLSEGLKADLIVRKDRPFSIEEFRRRRQATIAGRTVSIASAEDVILSKLEWDRITSSERQVRDALEVLRVQGDRIDRSYLQYWARELGVENKLDELLRQVFPDAENTAGE
jgi:hypothetical protein